MSKKSLVLFIILTFIVTSCVFYFLKKQKDTLVVPFARNQLSKNVKSASVINPRLGIEEIFNENHYWASDIPDNKRVTLIATGDVIPARSVNYQTIVRNNFNWAFEKTAEILKRGDIVLINLESPLVKNCPVTQSGMIFCGDEKHIQGLLFAGVNVANLSNNHLGNYGEDGVRNTVNLLKDHGILTTGINGPVFKEVKGIKFAFLGYGMIAGGEMVSWSNEEKIKSEIALAKNNSDVVIVSFHWGDEYTPQPNAKQREYAHLAIDSGADLIIGNHPHWIQPVEIYKGKLITYAHGNFIFDQMWSEKTKEGVVGRYTFYGKDLIDVEFLPVKIENYGQPYFLENTEKQKIIDDMYKKSILLNSKYN